jgi:hypothetical protein
MGWFAKNTTQKQEVFQDVVEGLRRLYVKNLRQLEDAYMFHNFHSPPLVGVWVMSCYFRACLFLYIRQTLLC